MLKSIRKIAIRHWFFVAAVTVYALIQYIYFFAGGTYVLGGEGNYFLDFNVYMMNHSSSWINVGSGELGPTVNSGFVYPLIARLIPNDSIRSFLILFFSYMMPFTMMYILLNHLIPSRNVLSFLLAFFYIANPFSIHYLLAINPWNIHVYSIYPLYLYIFTKFYHRRFELFMFFGISTALLSYAFTNPPQMVLIFLSLPFLIYVASILQDINPAITSRSITHSQQPNRYKLPARMVEYFNNICIVFLSLGLYNFWWLTNWVLVLPDAQKVYTLKFAKSWLENQTVVSPAILKDFFSFMWIAPQDPAISFLSRFFSYPLIFIALYVPFFIIIHWAVSMRGHKSISKVVAVLFAGMFTLSLFMKGISPPFAKFLSSCFDYVRYCYIFKTAPEKFGVPYIFLASVSIYLILTHSKQWVKVLFYAYIAILFVPFVTGQYLPDTKIDTNDYMTRKYIEPREFKTFRSLMKAEPYEFRLLSLPNAGNYQIKIHLYSNRYYTGLNPVLMNIPHAYIADHNREDYHPLFRRIDSYEHSKLLGMFSIRYIHLNRKIRSWFGNLTGKTIPELEVILDKKYRHVADYGEISMYENPDFLPKFWIPDAVMPASAEAQLSDISDTIGRQKLPNGIAFLPRSVPVSQHKPIIEYKKIAVTKYRIILHKLSDSIPLIFNETYSNFWRLYAKSSRFRMHNGTADGNRPQTETTFRSQASQAEITSFKQNGWLSIGGLKFISKQVAGTIQNDNLPDGEWYETWKTNEVRQIASGDHMLANTYANAWMLDTQVICADNTSCLRNSDGTYDVELILELFPQKILYIGIIISITVFIGSVGFFVYKRFVYKDSTKN